MPRSVKRLFQLWTGCRQTCRQAAKTESTTTGRVRVARQAGKQASGLKDGRGEQMASSDEQAGDGKQADSKRNGEPAGRTRGM